MWVLYSRYYCSHPYRSFRSVKRPSSDPKISRSMKRFTQKSIMPSISTPRPSPFPTRFTPEIVTNLWTMAPDFLPVSSLSMDTLQMVIVCNSIFRHVYLFPYETLAGHFSSALLTPSPEVMHQQVSRWLSLLCFVSDRSHPFHLQGATFSPRYSSS